MEDILIIGVCGFAGAGKDTFANYLVENHGFRIFSFAEALKDVLSIVFSWDRKMLEGDTKESREWRERVDETWANELKIENFSPRKAMQIIGTDLFRNFFHQDIWAIVLKNKILSSQGRKVVVTDCRFVNEFKILKKNFKYFYVFNVIRWVPSPDEGKWYYDLKENVKTEEQYKNFCEQTSLEKHKSEFEWIWAINFLDLKLFCIHNTSESVEDFKNNEIKSKLEDISSHFKDVDPISNHPLYLLPLMKKFNQNKSSGG